MADSRLPLNSSLIAFLGSLVSSFLITDFKRLKQSETFMCFSCQGECKCAMCNEESLNNDLKMLENGTDYYLIYA